MQNILEIIGRKASRATSSHAATHGQASYQLPKLEFSAFKLSVPDDCANLRDLEKDGRLRDEACSDTQEIEIGSPPGSDPTLV